MNNTATLTKALYVIIFNPPLLMSPRVLIRHPGWREATSPTKCWFYRLGPSCFRSLPKHLRQFQQESIDVFLQQTVNRGLNVQSRLWVYYCSVACTLDRLKKKPKHRLNIRVLVPLYINTKHNSQTLFQLSEVVWVISDSIYILKQHINR